jgi:RNA polymerase sigma factor (sigma-70 family)
MWPNDFEEWYVRAFPEVYDAVYRYLRRRRLHGDRAGDRAEEATQEAARRAAERIAIPAYFESREHLRNWMILVARRFASDQLDRERAGQLPVGHDEPQRASSREEFFGRVWDCLSQLPEQDQRILDWYYWDRLTDEQIGQILFDRAEGPTAALGLRAHRMRRAALTRLQQCLIQRGIDPAEWNLDAPSWRQTP